MNKTVTFFLAILFIIAVFYVCRYCYPKTEVITTTEHISDTIIIEHVDTIVDTLCVMVREKLLDTIYIETKHNDSIALPVTQKHYSDTLNYDLWVSGFKPNLDSIKVYTKTTNVNVQNNTTKVIEAPQKSKVYVFCGLNALQGEFIPKVGVSLKTKKEWLITPEIGLYHNKPFYGISIGKNINFSTK